MVLQDVSKRQTEETASLLPVTDRQIGRQTDSNHFCPWSKQAHTHTILITLSVYTPTDNTGRRGGTETKSQRKTSGRDGMGDEE